MEDVKITVKIKVESTIINSTSDYDTKIIEDESGITILQTYKDQQCSTNS